MELVEIVERGRSGDDVVFSTGRPVTFEYLRNTDPSPPVRGTPTFQQDIDPAGRYMLHAEKGTDVSPPRPWETGTITFESPLVLAFNTRPGSVLYDDRSWKAALRDRYRATGQRLSRKIAADGYDGIVTVHLDDEGRPAYTKEIVDLTMFVRSRNASIAALKRNLTRV